MNNKTDNKYSDPDISISRMDFVITITNVYIREKDKAIY